jgi:acetolactate synthase small subunit
MRHIIAILLQNEAGALTRVASMFSSRGYNIESLSVAPTDDATESRLTLVTTGSDAVILQIVNQLKKLVDVVSVDDMTQGEHVERELVLPPLKVEPARRDAARAIVMRIGGRVPVAGFLHRRAARQRGRGHGLHPRFRRTRRTAGRGSGAHSASRAARVRCGWSSRFSPASVRARRSPSYRRNAARQQRVQDHFRSPRASRRWRSRRGSALAMSAGPSGNGALRR